MRLFLILSLATTLSSAAGIPLHISPLGGPSGNAATKILTADLERSGRFTLLDTPSPGAHAVSGSSTGGRIDGVLTSPGGKRIFARTYNGPGIKKNAHRFADDISQTITENPGIASATIAFVSDQSGVSQIYLCDADGSHVRQVTSDPSPSVSPCISPDGSYLTFTSYRTGYPSIAFIDLLTGSRQPVIDSPGTNGGAAIAPDGRRIALTKSLTGNPELYLSQIGGGRSTRLTRTALVESSPTWSPDGHELAFTAFAEGSPPSLFRIRTSGGKPTRLETGHAHSDSADWSPDGDSIAFDYLDGTRTSRVAVLDLDSGEVKPLGRGSEPAWAPDSRHLAYTRSGTLVLHDVVTGSTATLVTAPGTLSGASWTR